LTAALCASDRQASGHGLRERQGRTLPFVFKSEAASVPTIEARVHPSAIIHPDEATSCDHLGMLYVTKRINH
jgi:hypothetical protein